MILKKWEDLPEQLQTDAVRPYYEVLKKKQGSLIIKRIFDVVVSALMLLVLSPVFLILAVAIKLDSPGPVFYRQDKFKLLDKGIYFLLYLFLTHAFCKHKKFIATHSVNAVAEKSFL